MKLGFLDSGLGGAHLLSSVRNLFPEESYEFYGDTANLPYGNKTREEVFKLLNTGLQHLFARGCDKVIIACNTASSVFIESSLANPKILDCITPTIEEVLRSGVTKPILVATERTISSGLYQKSIPGLLSVSAPTLASLIENGSYKEALDHLTKLIEPYKQEIDSVILGCTHYSLLKQGIRERFQNLRVFSQDEIIPEVLKKIIPQSSSQKRGETNVYLTGGESSKYTFLHRE